MCSSSKELLLDIENLKSLIIYPGHKVLLISKFELYDNDAQVLADKAGEVLGSGNVLVIDGTQFEVAVVDSRQIESYVPEFMQDP